MPEYNLVDEAWLTLRPVGAGPPRGVGLAEALLDAHAFEGVVVEFSTQLPAVMRQVLLPVFGDALGVPSGRAEWAERFSRGRLSDGEAERLRRYLDEHRDRFDLFSEVAPFGQAAGLRTAKDETKGSAALVATAASGNNVPLFASRTDADPLELTPAQAVHWLLHTLCWDTAAIKTGAAGDPQVKAGKTTGNPTGPLGQLGVVMPVGRTLYETLLLNLPWTPASQVGEPQWKRPPAGPGWEPRYAEGLLDLWTWQGRRIRLIPQAGAGGPKVTRVVVCAGDRLEAIPASEPHTTWNLGQPAKKAGGAKSAVGERRPRRHTPGKAAWRGLEALLAPARESNGKFETSALLEQFNALLEAGTLEETYPLQVQTFGIVYGTQSSVVEDVLHDAVPLPLPALRDGGEVHDLLLEVADQAEKLAWTVNNLSADLRRAVGADPVPWDKGQRPGELLLHVLDPLVRRLLAGVQRAGSDEAVLARGRLAWEQVAWQAARSVAEPLFDAAPADAFRGREVQQAGKGTRTSVYSLGAAESNFRRQLAFILPRQADVLRAAAAARRETETRATEDGSTLGAGI
ncbi:type I-E CRISPR-associated protein Cse1/CasA [Kitasatospora kazusensis]|uniref:Type I-E CRISPR-associated protein Cse1/CasA n=1 Tax=Kitasatospora kazusensis TaxID=407974 RepID=A0ABP5LVU7_9ACTN